MKLADVLAAAIPFLATDKKPEDLKAAILAADRKSRDSMPGNTGEAKEVEAEREARDERRAKDRKARDRARAKDRKAHDARIEEDRAARDAERDDDPEHTNDAAVEDRKARDAKRASDRKARDEKIERDRKARDAKRAADRKARDAAMESGEAADAAREEEAEDESREDAKEKEEEAEDEDRTEGADPSTAAHGGKSESPTIDSAEVDKRISAAVAADRLARDALYAAQREVEPILGVVSFDSAPKAYRAALSALQVDTKGIPDAALPAMLKLAKDRSNDSALALDSGTTAAMAKAIAGYDRLK